LAPLKTRLINAMEEARFDTQELPKITEWSVTFWLAVRK
jgi:hypothetical protein